VRLYELFTNLLLGFYGALSPMSVGGMVGYCNDCLVPDLNTLGGGFLLPAVSDRDVSRALARQDLLSRVP
jgi:hypothetical protein